MIRSFRHKGLQKFYETGSTAGIQAKHEKRIALVLQHLETALQASDLGFANFGLHPLKGDLKGFWSVSVSGAWRIIFRMEHGEVHDVNYLNYH